jgi:hypothetical protein
VLSQPLTEKKVSRQCGFLNISQPYRPPRPVTGIASTCARALVRVKSPRSIWHIQENWSYGNSKGKDFSVLDYLSAAHGGVWGTAGILPRFPDLGTSLRWVLSLLPLYPQRKDTQYPLDMSLDYGRYGKEKILDTSGTRTPTPPPSSPYPVAIPTAP